MFNSPWFVPLNEHKSPLLLFLFHHSGASVSKFRDWATALNGFVEVIGIQLPGREERFGENLLFTSKEVSDSLIKVFPEYLDRPFMMMGHSMGGILAFDFINCLKKNNYKLPQHFLVSGKGAPHLPNPNKLLYNLPQHEFVEELIKYNGIPMNIIDKPEIMEFFLPIVQADFSISDTYVYTSTPPLSCPITAFGGTKDPFVKEEYIKEWKNHTKSFFEYQMFEGGHFFLIEEAARPIIEKIREIGFSVLNRS